MRFLHTSDWHLGRIFHGVHLTEDQAYVLEQFVDLVKDTRPEAIVIAGDIYDRSVPPVEAVELLNDTLSRLLLDFHIPILMIAGNHDSPERLGFASRLLSRQGLYVAGVLSTPPVTVILEDQWGPVYFAPLPYVEPVMAREVFARPDIDSHEKTVQAMVSGVLEGIPKAYRKVALAHAFIAGGEESQSERPLSVGGSASIGADIFSPFNYTALGHLHNSQQAGQEHIRYSGSLLKYSFSEASQKKGINLVEIDGLGMVNTDCIALRPKRDVRCIKGCFADVLRLGQQDSCNEDYLLITLEDRNPILDAMGKLRQVYPNVLQLERPHLTTGGQLQGVQGDHRNVGEAELFAAFFEQMTGQKLTNAEQAEFNAVLAQVNREAGV